MIPLLARLFWRIILPLAAGLVILVIENIRQRRHTFFFSADDLAPTDELARKDIHKWGKEAEEFESRLKEADEIEKERRRRSEWMER